MGRKNRRLVNSILILPFSMPIKCGCDEKVFYIDFIHTKFEA